MEDKQALRNHDARKYVLIATKVIKLLMQQNKLISGSEPAFSLVHPTSAPGSNAAGSLAATGPWTGPERALSGSEPAFSLVCPTSAPGSNAAGSLAATGPWTGPGQALN